MMTLEEKREQALEAIKPICEAFDIKKYNYLINEEDGREILMLNETLIGCDCNSIEATVNEVIGYVFVNTWCRCRSLGAFKKQTLNIIKCYWIKER